MNFLCANLRIEAGIKIFKHEGAGRLATASYCSKKQNPPSQWQSEGNCLLSRLIDHWSSLSEFFTAVTPCLLFADETKRSKSCHRNSEVPRGWKWPWSKWWLGRGLFPWGHIAFQDLSRTCLNPNCMNILAQFSMVPLSTHCVYLFSFSFLLFLNSVSYIMGSSAQNSSGVHWCWRRVRFNEVPEQVPKVPEKVWEALVQSQVRFNRVPEKVPGEVLGRLWYRARSGSTGFQRRFRRSSGRLSCRARLGSTGFAAIYCNSRKPIWGVSSTWLRSTASERFVKIKRCGWWGYHRSLFMFLSFYLGLPQPGRCPRPRSGCMLVCGAQVSCSSWKQRTCTWKLHENPWESLAQRTPNIS